MKSSAKYNRNNLKLQFNPRDLYALQDKVQKRFYCTMSHLYLCTKLEQSKIMELLNQGRVNLINNVVSQVKIAGQQATLSITFKKNILEEAMEVDETDEEKRHRESRAVVFPVKKQPMDMEAIKRKTLCEVYQNSSISDKQMLMNHIATNQVDFKSKYPGQPPVLKPVMEHPVVSHGQPVPVVNYGQPAVTMQAVNNTGQPRVMNSEAGHVISTNQSKKVENAMKSYAEKAKSTTEDELDEKTAPVISETTMKTTWTKGEKTKYFTPNEANQRRPDDNEFPPLTDASRQTEDPNGNVVELPVFAFEDLDSEQLQDFMEFEQKMKSMMEDQGKSVPAEKLREKTWILWQKSMQKAFMDLINADNPPTASSLEQQQFNQQQQQVGPHIHFNDASKSVDMTNQSFGAPPHHSTGLPNTQAMDPSLSSKTQWRGRDDVDISSATSHGNLPINDQAIVQVGQPESQDILSKMMGDLSVNDKQGLKNTDQDQVDEQVINAEQSKLVQLEILQKESDEKLAKLKAQNEEKQRLIEIEERRYEQQQLELEARRQQQQQMLEQQSLMQQHQQFNQPQQSWPIQQQPPNMNPPFMQVPGIMPLPVVTQAGTLIHANIPHQGFPIQGAPLPGELQQPPPQQIMQQPDLQQHGYLPQFDQLAQAAGGAPPLPPSHPGVFGTDFRQNLKFDSLNTTDGFPPQEPMQEPPKPTGDEAVNPGFKANLKQPVLNANRQLEEPIYAQSMEEVPNYVPGEDTIDMPTQIDEASSESNVKKAFDKITNVFKK